MSAALEACPFCGSEDVRLFPPTCLATDAYDPSDRIYPLVQCWTCTASVPGVDGDKGPSAVANWNRRVATQTAGTPLNQCDGCRRGLPLQDGIHVGGDYDLIGCTADLYWTTETP